MSSHKKGNDTFDRSQARDLNNSDSLSILLKEIDHLQMENKLLKRCLHLTKENASIKIAEVVTIILGLNEPNFTDYFLRSLLSDQSTETPDQNQKFQHSSHFYPIVPSPPTSPGHNKSPLLFQREAPIPSPKLSFSDNNGHKKGFLKMQSTMEETWPTSNDSGVSANKYATTDVSDPYPSVFTKNSQNTENKIGQAQGNPNLYKNRSSPHDQQSGNLSKTSVNNPTIFQKSNLVVGCSDSANELAYINASVLRPPTPYCIDNNRSRDPLPQQFVQNENRESLQQYQPFYQTSPSPVSFRPMGDEYDQSIWKQIHKNQRNSMSANPHNSTTSKTGERYTYNDDWKKMHENLRKEKSNLETEKSTPSQKQSSVFSFLDKSQPIQSESPVQYKKETYREHDMFPPEKQNQSLINIVPEKRSSHFDSEVSKSSQVPNNSHYDETGSGQTISSRRLATSGQITMPNDSKFRESVPARNLVGSPIAASTPKSARAAIVPREVNNESDNDVLWAAKLTSERPASQQKTSVLYRPVDDVIGFTPILTEERKVKLRKIKPSKRLIGEIAFQLDRRILEFMFSWKIFSDKSKKKRYYGYSIANLGQMIKKEATEADGKLNKKKELELRYRLYYLKKTLIPYGYNFDFHGLFSQDMVNKYGLFQGPPDKSTIKDLGLDDLVILRMLLKDLIGDPTELQNMLIMLDCLCLISKEDKKPLFLW